MITIFCLRERAGMGLHEVFNMHGYWPKDGESPRLILCASHLLNLVCEDIATKRETTILAPTYTHTLFDQKRPKAKAPRNLLSSSPKEAFTFPTSTARTSVRPKRATCICLLYAQCITSLGKIESLLETTLIGLNRLSRKEAPFS
eukprot:scaffold48_cov311-Pinguiococcus_pyrenoidosus.AAC.271